MRAIKALEGQLERTVVEKYPTLTTQDIKTLVIDRKWMDELALQIIGEVDSLSQKLTGRVQELAERYSETVPDLEKEVDLFSGKVEEHLKTMGFLW